MIRRFKVGDKVVIAPDHRRARDHGRVFTVSRVNPKNYICTADDGGRGLNFPDEALAPYDPAAPAASAVGVPFVAREFFDIGQLVTFARPLAKYGVTTETPFVVIADKATKVNVTRLGGDGGRYLRAAPSGLVKRDVAWLADLLRQGVG